MSWKGDYSRVKDRASFEENFPFDERDPKEKCALWDRYDGRRVPRCGCNHCERIWKEARAQKESLR